MLKIDCYVEKQSNFTYNYCLKVIVIDKEDYTMEVTQRGTRIHDVTDMGPVCKQIRNESLPTQDIQQIPLWRKNGQVKKYRLSEINKLIILGGQT